MKLRHHDRLEDLYRTTRHEFFTYALSITRDAAHAEDAIHTAFEHLLSSKKRPLNLRPYAFRSIRNAAIDQRPKSPPDPLYAQPKHQADPSRISQHREAEAMMAHISQDERETIILKLYAGLTFRQIAKIRNVPQNTAASSYRRGIEKLRKLYEVQNHERR